MSKTLKEKDFTLLKGLSVEYHVVYVKDLRSAVEGLKRELSVLTSGPNCERVFDEGQNEVLNRFIDKWFKCWDDEKEGERGGVASGRTLDKCNNAKGRRKQEIAGSNPAVANTLIGFKTDEPNTMTGEAIKELFRASLAVLDDKELVQFECFVEVKRLEKKEREKK